MLIGCIKIFKIAFLDFLCKVHDKTKSRSFFPSLFFCGEATKKTSIDGLKWRDLVMVVWVGGGW